MKAGELGEFGLIELIAGIVGKPAGRALVLGIGDDASVWHTDKATQIGTTDTLVQDVHFTFDTATWRELGWKALAINISDIAAMGGEPLYALVSLGLHPDTDVEDVVEFYRGLLEIAGEFDVEICGGNISSAAVAVINVSVIGQSPDTVLMRSAALPGDRIAVTGYLGQAAAGFEMFKSGLAFDTETTAFLRAAQLHPYPRVAEGRLLAQHGVKAAIDLSDGLLNDLSHICKASGVGARVNIPSLPVHPMVKAAFGVDSVGLAVSGGEDYELLFTATSEVIDSIKGLMPTPITVTGEIVSGKPGQVTLYDEQGKPVEYDKYGWEHFKTSG